MAGNCATSANSRLVISTPSGTTDNRSAVITGSSKDGAGLVQPGTSVEIDENGLALDVVPVAADGTWSAQVLLQDIGPNTLTARTGQGAQQVVSDPVVLTLATVLSPSSIPAGAGQFATRIFPTRDATVSGSEGADTFVFRPHRGHVVVEDFALSGAGADHLSLPQTRLTNIADVLRHTTMSEAGAVIHLSPRDTITLVGVSKAELRADSGFLLFHH